MVPECNQGRPPRGGDLGRGMEEENEAEVGAMLQAEGVLVAKALQREQRARQVWGEEG